MRDDFAILQASVVPFVVIPEPATTLLLSIGSGIVMAARLSNKKNSA
jgi:hypothetical protein